MKTIYLSLIFCILILSLSLICSSLKYGLTVTDYILLITALFVLLYTYETNLYRKETEKLRKDTLLQNKLLIKPIISLKLDKKHSNVYLVNYGNEIAYNVRITDIYVCYNKYDNDCEKEKWNISDFKLQLLLSKKPSMLVLTRTSPSNPNPNTMVTEHIEFFDEMTVIDVFIEYQDKMGTQYNCMISVNNNSIVDYQEL